MREKTGIGFDESKEGKELVATSRSGESSKNKF